ncbi:MAG: hypothetical protein HOQ45_06770 [Nocardioidaceae bacterium]|nr:hypothetical protein [Nocardioidaceae bacterium]
MKWTPGAMALLTAAVLVTLVAVGIGYVVHSEPRDTTFVTSVAGAGSPSSPSPSPTSPTSPSPRRFIEPVGTVTQTARPTPTKKPSPTKKPKPTKKPAAPPPELTFTVSSFNVLGASHTRGGARGMAPGAVRARHAAELIRRHGAEVVGFQELQGGQLAVLRRHTNLDFWPGSALRARDTENSIGWRRDTWAAVDKRVVSIPYFDGHPRPMPYVKLRHLRTGLEAWFANFHNPADTGRYPHQQRFRDRATAIEISLANQLVRQSGDPVFITGDMNERDEYFCRMTAGAPMIAARGGSNVGSCQPGNPRAVDWIFGSQGVDFTGYTEDRSPLVRRTTDHPVIVARVHIVGDAPASPTTD